MSSDEAYELTSGLLSQRMMIACDKYEASLTSKSILPNFCQCTGARNGTTPTAWRSRTTRLSSLTSSSAPSAEIVRLLALFFWSQNCADLPLVHQPPPTPSPPGSPAAPAQPVASPSLPSPSIAPTTAALKSPPLVSTSAASTPNTSGPESSALVVARRKCST